MDDKIKHALANDRVIDITTTGRQSGQPRRLEIWFHNVDGRLYITRNAVPAVGATDSNPAREAVPGRVTVFDLQTLKSLGEIMNVFRTVFGEYMEPAVY